MAIHEMITNALHQLTVFERVFMTTDLEQMRVDPDSMIVYFDNIMLLEQPQAENPSKYRRAVERIEEKNVTDILLKLK